MELIRPFEGLGKHDAGIAGGKGASLGEMTQAGIPVPPGFVVLSSSFERFLEETDLGVEIDSILHGVDTKAMHTVEHASETIQKLILEASMPEDIKVLIQESFVELGAQFVAVRSSATAEDSASAAWAGQLDSFLNTTEVTLLENVQRCWASLFTPRAIFYRFEQGLHESKISVAVVVQKMVESEVSGIAFSVHPVTEDRNQLIIEAGFGLGEAIVSGSVTPDSYVVEKEPRRIIDVNVSTQSRALYRVGEAGGNEWRDIPEPKASSQVLTEAQILELSGIIVGIENHYGFPCDIEWAYEGGKFYIVQSRPITTLAPLPEEKEEIEEGEDGRNGKERWSVIAKDYNSYYLRSYIWTLGINRAGTIIPELRDFKKTLAIRSKRAEIEYLAQTSEWKKMHDTLVALLKNDLSLLRKVIYDTNAYAEKATQRGKEIFESPLGEATDDQLMGYLRELSSLQMGIYAYGVLLPLLDLNDQQFVEKHIKDFLNQKISPEKVDDYFLTVTAPEEETFASQQERALLALAQVCWDEPDLRATVLQETPAEILSVLRERHSAFASALEEHTKQYAWVYYSFAGPAYTEKDFLLFIKDMLSNSELSPKEKLSRAEAEKNELLQKKQQRIRELNPDPFHKELMELAGTFVWAKPTRKDYQSHLYFYIIDGVLAEIAKRVGISVTQALSCPFEMLEKALHTRNIDTTLLDSIYRHHVVVPKEGDVELFYGETLQEITPCIELEKSEDYSHVEKLTGTVARKGRARGIVKIINKPEDMEKMGEGDVLVSVATTPSIVPAMKKASAIITNEGGITCHAAIVSRELGIPCVIGTKIATQVLKDGDLVEVDADKGVVRIIEKHEL